MITEGGEFAIIIFMKKPWFRAKKYGLGWGLPVTWQGWVVLIAYLVFIFWDFARIDRYSHSASDTIRPFFIQFLAITAILVAVIYFTGERKK